MVLQSTTIVLLGIVYASLFSFSKWQNKAEQMQVAISKIMAFSFTLGGSSTYIFYYITDVRENL